MIHSFLCNNSHISESSVEKNEIVMQESKYAHILLTKAFVINLNKILPRLSLKSFMKAEEPSLCILTNKYTSCLEIIRIKTLDIIFKTSL